MTRLRIAATAGCDVGFGYKTAWIAVRGRTPQEVADALGLTDRRPMGYAEGTAAAYEGGVYVSPLVQGWILAHGRGLGDSVVLESAEILEWLGGLSKSLGTLQFFGTHRRGRWPAGYRTAVALLTGAGDRVTGRRQRGE